MYQDKLTKYLDDLASGRPTPGGGSAAALVAAAGAALLAMVCNFTIGKEKYKSAEKDIKKCLGSIELLRLRLTELVDEDAKGYKKVSAAYKLPKDTYQDKKKRTKRIQAALKEALAVPVELCQLVHQAAKLAPQLREKGNPNLISDVAVACALFEAAFEAALFNVEINLSGLKDEALLVKTRAVLKPMEKEVSYIVDEVKSQVRQYLVK